MEKLVAAVPLFSGLLPRTLARIAKDATATNVRNGAVIFRPGEPCSGMHIVVSGRVKLALPRPDAHEKVIGLVGPGGWFGETALFLRQAHLVSAQTVGPTMLLHIPAASVLPCIRRNPDFAEQMIAELSRRLREQLSDIDRSTSLSGMERLIDFLLAELPPEAKGTATLVLPAKKRVIASRLDLTHEHLSRMFADLARAGLLAVEGARVHIRNVARLRERLVAGHHDRV